MSQRMPDYEAMRAREQVRGQMSADHHPPHAVAINVPSVPYGPKGISAEKADAGYYRSAARTIRHAAQRGQSFAGSNLTETVAKLCDSVADALSKMEDK